ncbi:hypothetical protein Bbelb_004020 [Branchiostoma belcheri]|nr:hypothetical protein Bbelb_004020 [Branchiostoma belcheri]
MSKAVTHSPWRLLYPSSCRSTNQHEPHDTPWGLCSLSSSYEHRCQLTGPRCVKVPTAARVKSISKEETPGHSVGPLQRCTVKEGHLGGRMPPDPPTLLAPLALHSRFCARLRAPSALPSQNPSVKLGRLKKCKLGNVDSDSPLFVDTLGDQGRTMFKVSTKREEGASEDMRGLNRSTSKRLNRSKILKWSTSKRLRRNT